jgi:hypothetical protein
MSPIETAPRRPVHVAEPFRRYAADWSATTARTDTPDLMGMFAERQRDALMAEGFRESYDDDSAAAERDMAAGFETLPE